MPIKVVIDTNVMVSVAFAKKGLAKELRDMIADEAFILIISKDILTELYRVLHYPHILQRFNPSKEDLDEFIGTLIEHAVLTDGKYSLHKIADDPTDDKFLACAMETGADYIVSRDPHLRSLKHYHGIQIIDAATFIQKVKGN